MIDPANFTALDWVIVVVLGASTLLSLWRGFAREALSLAGWVAAFLVANLMVDQMASLLAGTINNITGRYVAAYAILFVATLMVCSLISIMVARLVKATGLSVLDRLLGTVFGFARGIILVLVVVFVIRQLVPPENLLWLHQSQLMPQLEVLSQWTQMVFADFNTGQVPGIST
jgi:membrane protein required for colicin V production